MLFILSTYSSIEEASIINSLKSLEIPSKATSEPITGVPQARASTHLTFTPAPLVKG